VHQRLARTNAARVKRRAMIVQRTTGVRAKDQRQCRVSAPVAVVVVAAVAAVAVDLPMANGGVVVVAGGRAAPVPIPTACAKPPLCPRLTAM
jgi:hypothetical protein